MRLPWPLLPFALLAACQPAAVTLPDVGDAGAYKTPPPPAALPKDTGGRLVGKSKIPEGLVPASAGALRLDGAAVISNSGGQLVPAGNGAYALLATGQKPLAGFTVRLLDAAGQPLLDPGGKPYEARTDAAGAYTFETTPVGKPAVVAIDLPGALGRVMAFLPAPAAVGTRTVDLEGVGTHVMGYLLDQHVKGDATRFKLLEADAEAAARAAAEATLAAKAEGKLAADSLATAKLVATVGVWRGLSKPFDERLTAIARTLNGLPPARPSTAPTPAPTATPSATPTPSEAPSAAP